MAGERWIFTKSQIQNTPSRKSGIDSDKELTYRQNAANLIQELGQRLPVQQLCINTAIVYMHRFYMFHSFTRFHQKAMAPVCLFLAAKVEEQPRKLEHVLKVAHLVLQKEGPFPDPQSNEYLDQAHELVVNENILLQTLGFDLTVDHPHTKVVKTCQLVRASKDLAQTSYFLATNSLHLTTLCLQHKPTTVACVCVHLACKWSNYEIPKSTEGREWYWYMDKNMQLNVLEELTQEFLNILDKCPTNLRKKILSLKSGQHTEDPNLGFGETHKKSRLEGAGPSPKPSTSHSERKNEKNLKALQHRPDQHAASASGHRERDSASQKMAHGAVSSGPIKGSHAPVPHAASRDHHSSHGHMGHSSKGEPSSYGSRGTKKETFPSNASASHKSDRAQESVTEIKDILGLSRSDHSKMEHRSLPHAMHQQHGSAKNKEHIATSSHGLEELSQKLESAHSAGSVSHDMQKNSNFSASHSSENPTRTSYKEYKERKERQRLSVSGTTEKQKDVASRPGLFESVTEKSLLDVPAAAAASSSSQSVSAKKETSDPLGHDIGAIIENDMKKAAAAAAADKHAPIKKHPSQVALPDPNRSDSSRNKRHHHDQRQLEQGKLKTEHQVNSSNPVIKSESVPAQVTQKSKPDQTSSPHAPPQAKVKTEVELPSISVSAPKTEKQKDVKSDIGYSPLSYRSDAVCSPVAGSENKIVIKRETGMSEGSPLKLKIKTSQISRDQSPHKDKKHHSHSSKHSAGEQKVPPLKISQPSSKVQTNDKHSSKSSSRHGEANILNKSGEGTNGTGRSELKLHINMSALQSKKHGDSKSERREKHKKSHRHESPSASASRKRPYSPAEAGDLHKNKISKSEGALRRSSSNHSLVSMDMSDSGSSENETGAGAGSIEVPMGNSSSNNLVNVNSPHFGQFMAGYTPKVMDMHKRSMPGTVSLSNPPLPPCSPPPQPPLPPPPNSNVHSYLKDIDFLSDDVA